tara:strand:+ start:6251 stop:7387 length:1137 start_codon:yes stop_codon:yes gene_type:complete
MTGDKITVDSDKVKINDYEITDEDVVKHFDSLKEQGKNLNDELDKLLKLGAIAAKATTVGLSTDYVDKSVNDLKNNFENLFGQTFDEGGTIPRLLAENFGEDGKVITELLNPDKTGSPMHALKEHMDTEIQQLRTDLNVDAALTEQRKKDPKKGADFEKHCEDMLRNFAKSNGDIVEDKHGVPGDLAPSKKGDYVYNVSELGKNIVLDMKDYTTRLTLREKCLDVLDEAMPNRDAEYGILVSKRKSVLPKEVGMFQEYDGNKLIVALTASDDEDALTEDEILTVAIKWARLRLRSKSGTLDAGKIIEKMKNIEIQLKRFSTIKNKCKSISDTSDGVKSLVDEIGSEIKENLEEIINSLNGTPEASESTEEKSKDVLDL